MRDPGARPAVLGVSTSVPPSSRAIDADVASTSAITRPGCKVDRPSVPPSIGR